MKREKKDLNDYKFSKEDKSRSKKKIGTSFFGSEKFKNLKDADRELISNVVLSVLIVFLVEIICRKSISSAFYFFLDFTLEAVINCVLVFLFLSISMFCKRKLFVKFLIAFILFLLASINSAVTSFRGMPFFPYDLLSFKEAFRISSVFLSIWMEVVIVIVLVIFIIFAIDLFRRENKNKRKISKRNTLVFFITLLTYLLVVFQLTQAKIIKNIAWNPAISFEQNGFVYSFTKESILAFRKKPKGYNEKNIKAIREKLDKCVKEDKRTILKGEQRPNIVIVQLEAFMDPTRIKGVKFNKDPMPYMRNLMNDYTSGLMDVPTVGGGTARTEYEVLSGANFDYLNQGEIPYQTFLSKKASISLARDLDRDGYKTTAIHNFYQRFYNRNKGYKNLGFDKFIPLEVMTDVDYTPLSWPKDNVLIRYIDKQIKNQDKNDPAFVFTVSVQGHSKYPTTKLDMDYPVRLVDSTLNQADQNQINYYANQVKEMDTFVANLMSVVNSHKRPTVMVFYGDHLPSLDVVIRERDRVFKYSSLFVVTNNFGKAKEVIPNDFQAYQLSTLALKTAAQPYGPLNLVHAYLSKDKDYQKYLKLVQYDLLFGKKYFLKDNEKPVKVNMKISNEDLKFKKLEKSQGRVFIYGDGFNRNTNVYVDGKKVDAKYHNINEIEITDKLEKGNKEVYLEIEDNNGDFIQRTQGIMFEF